MNVLKCIENIFIIDQLFPFYVCISAGNVTIFVVGNGLSEPSSIPGLFDFSFAQMAFGK